MSTAAPATSAPHVARRIRDMAPSPTMAMAAKAAAIQQQGHKVLNLTLGRAGLRDTGAPQGGRASRHPRRQDEVHAGQRYPRTEERDLREVSA